MRPAARRARLFVRAGVPTELAHLRAACQQVIDGFRSPQLRVAPTLGDADLAIESQGCKHGLVNVLLVLMTLVHRGTIYRFGPLCARCRDPELCKRSGDELLHACQPWIHSALADSFDLLAGPDEEHL